MRTYARVDLARLFSNYRNIEAACPAGMEILAVLKADAYGHGAVAVSRPLESAGCKRFAVATLEEGATLRAAGVGASIVLLSGCFPGEEEEAARLDVTPMIPDEERLKAWRAVARKLGRKLPWHLEVDTGMGRLGMTFGSPDELAATLTGSPELHVEGVGIHLAAAEDFADRSAKDQLDRFHRLIRGVRTLGVNPGLVHAANSAAIAYRSLEGQTLVRPGLALYGYVSRPHGDAPASRLDVHPALEWRTRVLTVRAAQPGDRLGYNGAFVVERPMLVATLGVGYADGYRRELSNRGEVLINAVRRPILGRISMDLTLVEADETVRAGQEAVLLGPGLDARELADRCGTIPYEILSGISARVPRVYESAAQP